MDNIINRIQNIPADITWIGIGSAVIRDTEPQNMQQFPPFIEYIYKNTNLNIRIINFDPVFEQPYFLTQYFNNLIKIDNNVYAKNRLEIIYINEEINITEEYIYILDQINRIIMDQNNLLICGIFTGDSCEQVENNFQKLYNDTSYSEYFNTNISYNFTNGTHTGCYCNLLENFPIIENNKIIKLNNIKPELIFNKYYEINNNLIALDKFKKIIINEFKFQMNLNHYVFRNLKNNNLTVSVKNSLILSIFNNITIDISIHFKNYLIIYYNIFNEIYQCSDDDLIIFAYLINNLDIENDYEWYNKMIKLINLYIKK
jgi:hypothetical protein